MTEYLVVYETAEDGAWGAWLPDIDGVVALGKTRDEVESRMREALAAFAEYEREEGRELPPPHNYAGYASAP
ncbi:MAG: type II toxin-antitoxin system HicB family antitoxin [Miltoncostaeaceae bacterium]